MHHSIFNSVYNKQSKYMKHLITIPNVIIVVMLSFLWLGLSSIGFSQNNPVDSVPYPPKNHPISELSSDKTFKLQKLEAPLPEKSNIEYSLETNLDSRIANVKDKTGKEIYQVTIPKIHDLEPALERPSQPDGFKEARVTQNGSIIVRYYDSVDFYYSKTNHKFTIMPEFLKDGEDVYQCSGWEEYAEDLFLAHLGTHVTEGDGIAIYDAKSMKVYKLEVPVNLQSEFVSLNTYDSSHSIVDVETLKRNDPRHDLEAEVTGRYGYYKIDITP